MASPFYDATSVLHSRNIGDKVSSASTDGVIWTSAQRDQHLNNAIRRWIEQKWQMRDFLALRSYKQDSPAVALSSNAIALTSASFTGGAIGWILSMYNSTSGVMIQRLPESLKNVILTSTNSYLKPTGSSQFYYISNGSIVVAGSGATDNIVVSYIAVHTNMSAGAGSDWLVPSTEQGTILKLALQEAMLEKPTQENVARISAVQPIIQTEISVQGDMK